MISITELKNKWQTAIGYTLFDEDGEVEHYYRQNNGIVAPVSGIFSTTPLTLSAIKTPTIAMLNANVTLAVPESRLTEVRNKLNETASTLNGTAFTTTDNKYTVAYNCQTCSVGDKQMIGAGAGEYFPVFQTISYVIIEGGVSAYNAKLSIDNMNVPILTLVETKVNTTQTVPDINGVGRALSQQEMIGFDFTCPFLNNDLGKLFHRACSDKTANELHYAEYSCNGVVKPHLVIFGNCTENVQPPANVGFNISIVDGEPLVGYFNGNMTTITATTSDSNQLKGVKFGNNAVVEQKNTSVTNELSVFGVVMACYPQFDNKESVAIFWGDGSCDYYAKGSIAVGNYHYFEDGETEHKIIVHLGV